jgi:hypothetical protein
MKKILLALFVTSALSASVNAQEVQPMSQDEFSWQEIQLSTNENQRPYFNRIKRAYSFVETIANNQSIILEGDTYRYIISNSTLAPLGASCNSVDYPIEVDTISGENFFYIPLEGLTDQAELKCRIDFQLKRIALSYTPIIQEGTWIE